MSLESRVWGDFDDSIPKLHFCNSPQDNIKKNYNRRRPFFSNDERLVVTRFEKHGKQFVGAVDLKMHKVRCSEVDSY